ncbi:MAG: M1 family peptidase, partial [Flavobacteriales bacterium]
MKIILAFISLILIPFTFITQISSWQQRVEYKMDVRLNHENHQYTGTSVIRYFNNSPDELVRMYFHLYPNAFQPGSSMDVQSRTIADPDPRVGDRIYKLATNEIGKLTVKSIKIDGVVASMTEM